jgi:hypothetical protein
MSDDLRLLLVDYKEKLATMSEKQKAESEQCIWMAWEETPNMPKFESRRDWAVATFGGSAAEYETRSMMLLAGPWTEPLWRMVDEGVSRGSVRNLFRQARKMVADEQVPHETALQRVIEAYNKMGYVAKTADGKVYRRMSPTEKQRSRPPPAMEDVPIEMDMDSTQNRRSKLFLSRLTSLTDEFLRKSVPGLNGIDELQTKIYRDEFVSYMREAVDDLRRRVYALRSSAKKERTRLSRVSRDSLRLASEVLGISVVWSQDVDLKKAKKIMLTRAAQLHPDQKGPQTEQQKAEYRAVIEAYKTLERYMEGRKSHEDGERSHEGK